MAARHLRQQIGRRRRDDDEIGVAGETNMADVELAVRIEQIGENALAAQRAGGERRDEVLRGGGQDAAHLCIPVLQAPDQVERFIGGDAAADDEQDAVAVRIGRTRLLPRRLRWRFDVVEDAGLFRGLAQDDADLVLHRPAVPRGAQAQQLLQLVVELPDGETGHWNFLWIIRG